MAKFPSTGVNIPGPINGCNASSMSGYQDMVGNPYWMGMTPGKIVTLGPTECAQYFAPGTAAYDGSYQWVQLDSSATAAYATEGMPAYIQLDPNAVGQGTLPETDYAVPIVTTQDRAAALGLLGFFAGIFLNPATLNGAPNTPTPGNWCFIFAGAGRAPINFGATVAGHIGDAVFPDATNTGKFESSVTSSTTPGLVDGVAAAVPVANTMGVAYYNDFILRIPF